mgnify:CR=1 FL=1|jgi:hypothetical protein
MGSGLYLSHFPLCLCDASGLGTRPGHLGVPISLQGIKFMSSLTLQPHV